MTLHAVIFDYGLVLSGPANPAAHAQLLRHSGLGHDTFEHQYWKHRLDYDRGTLNGHTYWETIAREAGIQFPPAAIDRLIEQDVRLWSSVNPVMLAWAARVRAAGFKTAILSNMGEDLLAHMRENFSWLETFDHHSWSCELNVTKPDAEIYRHTVKALGVQPEEALFLDDKIENVEGAREIGLHALVFRNPETLQADLHRESWSGQIPPVIQ